jgi:hypothetical protein
VARRLLVLCVLVASPLVISCGSDDDAAPGPGRQAVPTRPGQPPRAPSDLCAEIGNESLQSVVPGGEARADREDFGLYSETTCSFSSPTGTDPDRDLWIEFNRYGTEPAGRSPDQVCREAMRSAKTVGDWKHPSARELPLRLGDVTEAQVRAVRYDAEAEILLCRSGDFLRVRYEGDGSDRDAAAKAAETVARRVLQVYPR